MHECVYKNETPKMVVLKCVGPESSNSYKEKYMKTHSREKHVSSTDSVWIIMPERKQARMAMRAHMARPTPSQTTPKGGEVPTPPGGKRDQHGYKKVFVNVDVSHSQ